MHLIRCCCISLQSSLWPAFCLPSSKAVEKRRSEPSLRSKVHLAPCWEGFLRLLVTHFVCCAEPKHDKKHDKKHNKAPRVDVTAKHRKEHESGMAALHNLRPSFAPTLIRSPLLCDADLKDQKSESLLKDSLRGHQSAPPFSSPTHTKGCIADSPSASCMFAGEVTSICFAPNGQWLASAAKDRTLRLWRLGDPNKSYAPSLTARLTSERWCVCSYHLACA